MNLSLKRLFARSMTGGPELVQLPAPPSTRSAVRRATFVTAAGILAIVGLLAAGYYFATRPEVLRIAVGPANSDDVKVVQTLTQAFAQHRSYVRLKPVQTDGAVASAEALAENKVDLAVIRGDLDVPRNAQAVATLRKNYVVLWVPPPAKGKGKKAAPKITKISQLAGRKIGVVGKHPGQCQRAQADPAAIWRRSEQGRDRAVSGQRGRGSDPQAVGGRLSRRGSRQQQDHVRCDRGVRQGRRRADLPRHRCIGGDRDQPSRLRGGGNSLRHVRFARTAGRGSEDDQLLAPHRGAARPCRKPPSPRSRDSCSRSASNC